MILKKLRIYSILFQTLKYQVTGSKLLQATKSLVEIDSLKLDEMCEKVLQNCHRQNNNSSNQKQQKSINNQKNGEQLIQGVSSQNAQKIRFIYNSVSDANVGFLKGDIHSQFVFKLNKYINQKKQDQIQKDLQQDQFKKLLNLVTEVKLFRMPKIQIKRAEDEDPKNMYQRQLLLEQVSSEQASDKYEYILDSLLKVGKIHLVDVFRKYLVQWFPPLCLAIKQQQLKCLDSQNLVGKRKIYASFFVKLAAQRITLLCLSELLKAITNIIYKDYEKQSKLEQSELCNQKEEQLQQFDAIRHKTLCIVLSKWISIQQIYEEKQKKFKAAMNAYDAILKDRKQSKLEEIKKIQIQRKNQKKRHQIESSQSQTQESANKQIEQLVNEMFQKSQSKQQKQSDQIAKQKAHELKFKQVQQKYAQKYVSPQQRKSYLQEMSGKMMRQIHKYKSKMPEEVQYEIGSLLIYLMKQILQVENKTGRSVPLMVIQYKYFRRSGQTITDKRLKISQHFLKTILPQIQKQGNLFLHLDRSVPTIIQPLPWVAYQIGGYYLNPSLIMRFSHCRVQQRLIKYSDLTRVYNVLNYLGRIPWKINKKVLDVVEAIWEEGGGVGEIPVRFSELQTPYLTQLKSEKNYQNMKNLAKKIQQIRDEHSLRSDFNLKIAMARAFSKVDRFYYPHNLDFRGRVYPIPPHLNHIGNDLSRGLLLFADGKRLGQSGVKWLKIHCANLMGKDKAQLHEKIQFIQANLHLIKSIAEEPLKNREWLEYQDKWQALGAITQLNQVLKQPNPQQYVSCLHIHQDGSCNGLQHYAALGKDTEGAYQVNLGPTQKPGDVYTHVAKMVIKMVENDIANESSQFHELAKKIQGNIKRKTIKQTVMTSVYGVTFIGAREQIHKQLKDQAFLKDDDQQYKASIYLAKYTLQAISNLFSSAHLIKKWLISCAKLVASQGNPIGWITPIGLPVVQPYRKESNLDVVNTIIQSLKVAQRDENLPVNKSKQQSAFPPNFVHSLDSTHMMFTAQRCRDLGIFFAAVHDSYWTHAGTIQTMNKILREEFVRLHSMPLLENLKNSLEIRYPMIQFPDIPQKGDFDLNQIIKSKYFFS